MFSLHKLRLLSVNLSLFPFIFLDEHVPSCPYNRQQEHIQCVLTINTTDCNGSKVIMCVTRVRDFLMHKLASALGIK